MERKEKIQIGILAIFIILIIIAVWGVFQRQLLQKKAAKTGRPVSVQFVAPEGKKAGDTFETSIQMVSSQILPISGAEATINVGSKFTISPTNSICIAPFNAVAHVEVDNTTHTAKFLCAIDPATLTNNLPTLQIGQPMQFARVVLTINDKESGEASINFEKTRVTQAKVLNQAPDISNDGTNTVYRITVVLPSATIAGNRPPNCSGGIAIPNIPFTNNRFVITKGTTVKLNAYGITDPDGNNTIKTVIFRHKKTGLPVSEQCPNATDGSLIGQGQSGVDDSGIPIWTIDFNTTNVAEGDEYYIWANPSDGQMQCSGNPYGSPGLPPDGNNYCGVGFGCTNCKAIATIQVTGATPTSAPTPTQPIGGLSPTPTRTPTPTPTRIPTLTPVPSTGPTTTITQPPNCPRKGQGDADCDGQIDLQDYSIWLNHQCIPEAGQVCSDLRPDFDRDGDVDYHDNTNGTNTGDREIWARYFGQ